MTAMPVALHPLRKAHLLYAGLALLFLVSATYRVLDIAERAAELQDAASTLVVAQRHESR
jgi:hypothetical protein